MFKVKTDGQSYAEFEKWGTLNDSKRLAPPKSAKVSVLHHVRFPA